MGHLIGGRLWDTDKARQKAAAGASVTWDTPDWSKMDSSSCQEYVRRLPVPLIFMTGYYVILRLFRLTIATPSILVPGCEPISSGHNIVFRLL